MRRPLNALIISHWLIMYLSSRFFCTFRAPEVNGYLAFTPYSSCAFVSPAVTRRPACRFASFVLGFVIMIFREIVDVLNQSAMPAAAKTFCIYDNYPSWPLLTPLLLSLPASPTPHSRRILMPISPPVEGKNEGINYTICRLTHCPAAASPVEHVEAPAAPSAAWG